MNYLFGFPIDETSAEEVAFVQQRDNDLDQLSGEELWLDAYADPALWAMTAYANDIEQPALNGVKRQAFWTWRLHEAVPTAAGLRDRGGPH